LRRRNRSSSEVCKRTFSRYREGPGTKKEEVTTVKRIVVAIAAVVVPLGLFLASAGPRFSI
jgi:hypothetical protein